MTVWYAIALSIVLIIFAVISYNVLAITIRQRAQNEIIETMNGFVDFLITEKREQGDRPPDPAVVEATAEFPFRDQRFIIYSANDRVVASTSTPTIIPSANASIWSPKFIDLIPPLFKNVNRDDPVSLILPADEEDVHVLIRTFQLTGHKYKIALLYSVYVQEELLEQVQQIFYLAVPAMILLISVGGYLLVRNSLVPVVAMSEQATRISIKNIHERLPIINRHDELGRLAMSFNDLLNRLSEAFEQQKRFMADASHELRTPVAIVQGESEVALSQSVRSEEDYRESLLVINDEGRRLARIVEDLFTLARADAGQYPLVITDFYLDEMIGECVRAVRSLATKRSITIHCEINCEMLFHGDETLIRRLFLNLLDNAIKYSPPQGNIYVDGIIQEKNYLIKTSDTGIGIPLAAQQHIFERFYRVDKARSRSELTNGGGAGLGLAIARWIAEAHNGQLILDRSDAQGSSFLTILPRKIRSL